MKQSEKKSDRTTAVMLIMLVIADLVAIHIDQKQIKKQNRQAPKTEITNNSNAPKLQSNIMNWLTAQKMAKTYLG